MTLVDGAVIQLEDGTNGIRLCTWFEVELTTDLTQQKYEKAFFELYSDLKYSNGKWEVVREEWVPWNPLTGITSYE